MKKIRLLCIGATLFGICLIIFSIFALPDTSFVKEWCIGMASALIILGLGYFINSFLPSNDGSVKRNNIQEEDSRLYTKYKAGYLVCKLMNILLCIYILVINKLHTDPIILLLSIALVLIQYILDLSLQIYYAKRSDKNAR
jgi:hypothetical protein